MTAQELKDTGVSTLSPAQRTALDKLLNRYTEGILRVVSRSARGTIIGCKFGCRIHKQEEVLWSVSDTESTTCGFCAAVSGPGGRGLTNPECRMPSRFHFTVS
jgi:hypothetical protein